MKQSRAERAAHDRAMLGEDAQLAAWRTRTAMTDVERALDALIEIDVFVGELRRDVAVRTALRQTRGEPQHYERVLAGINADYHMTKPEAASLRGALDAAAHLEGYLRRRNGADVQRCEPYAEPEPISPAMQRRRAFNAAYGRVGA